MWTARHRSGMMFQQATLDRSSMTGKLERRLVARQLAVPEWKSLTTLEQISAPGRLSATIPSRPRGLFDEPPSRSGRGHHDSPAIDCPPPGLRRHWVSETIASGPGAISIDISALGGDACLPHEALHPRTGFQCPPDRVPSERLYPGPCAPAAVRPGRSPAGLKNWRLVRFRQPGEDACVAASISLAELRHDGRHA